MTGQQKAVLWMGLILIALNLVTKWPSIRAIIFTGSSPLPDSGSGKDNTGNIGGGSTGDNPSIRIPIDPFIPGPTSPKITIPLPKFLWLPNVNPETISSS